MIISTSRKLIQRFFLLGLLLSCLGLVSAGVGAKASAPGTNAVKPCCSVCEPDPTIPICRYGCIEGC
jgi:hypothetical protein